MRYLQGSLDLGLRYQRQSQFHVHWLRICGLGWQPGRSKVHLGLHISSKRSCNQLVQSETGQRGPVHAEAEYISLSAAAQEAIGLRGLSAEITGEEEKQIEVHEDNQSAICMASNPSWTDQTRRTEVPLCARPGHERSHPSDVLSDVLSDRADDRGRTHQESTGHQVQGVEKKLGHNTLPSHKQKCYR